MRTPHELTRRELLTIVDALQRVLYFDDEAEPPAWNPDRAWNGAEIRERLAALLARHDLIPSYGRRRSRTAFFTTTIHILRSR